MNLRKTIIIDWLGRTDFFVQKLANNNVTVLSNKFRTKYRPIRVILKLHYLITNIICYLYYVFTRNKTFIFNIPFNIKFDIFLIRMGRKFGNKYVLILHNQYIYHEKHVTDVSIYLRNFDKIITHDPSIVNLFPDDNLPIEFRWLPIIGDISTTNLDNKNINIDRITTFLFIGNVRPYKGLELFLRALSLLDPAIKRDVRIHIAGKHFYEIKYNSFNLLGFNSFEVVDKYLDNEHMQNLIAVSNCIVLPYLESSGSAVCSLALQNNKFILTSDLPVFKLFINYFGCGDTFVCGDSNSLSEKITYLARSPSLLSLNNIRNKSELSLKDYSKFIESLII